MKRSANLFSTPMFWVLLFLATSLGAVAQPNVQVGVYPVTGLNELEVRILPDAAWNAGDGVWDARVTIRYEDNAGVTLGAATLVPTYWPIDHMAPVIDQVNSFGGYTYVTYVIAGNTEPLDGATQWAANVQRPFFRISYTNTSPTCLTASTVADAYQSSNNLDWYMSLFTTSPFGITGTVAAGYIPGDAYPVKNTTTGEQFCSIQAAIDDIHTLAGHIITVQAGTYAEAVNVTKGVDLRGANYNTACTGARGAESIIAPASGTPFTVSADGVTINGFEVTCPTNAFGINASGRSTLHIRYNNIHDVYTTGSGTNPYGIIYTCTVNANDVVISDNCVDNINNTGNLFKSGGGIVVGFPANNGEVTNLVIERNRITDVTTSDLPFASGGRGAYGILVNVGAGAGTGKATGAIINQNEISNLSGFWAHGIGLEGETPGAQVTNNSIDNLSSTKVPVDAVGVMIEDNAGVASVSITGNSFTNTAIGIDNTTGTAPLPATNNWFGSASAAVVATRYRGNIDVTPFNNDGVDTNPSLMGFQPNAPLGVGPVTSNSPVDSWFTIQGGVDGSNPGAIVTVAAGTYAEHVIVNKSLDIRGPNYGVNGNSGSRVAEAIVVPEATLMPGDIWTEVVFLNANDISFDGFTVSGDNPSLAGYSYAGMDLDKGQCVYSEGNRVEFRNNIVEKATSMGFYAGGGLPTPQYVDLVVSNNKFSQIQDVAQLGYGFAMYIQATAGAITGNTVVNSRTGIQVQPYQVVQGPDGTPTVSGNSFSVWRQGIYYNYAEVGASAWTISGNTVTATTPPVALGGPVVWEGIRAETMRASSNGGTITGNNVNGSGAATDMVTWWGVTGLRYAGDASTSTQVYFTNNTVSNVETGMVHDAAADIVLTGNSLSASQRAIRVQRYFTSAGVMLGTGGVNNIDATGGNTINGVATAGATDTQLFAIEDAIDHRIDESYRGLVRVKTNHLHVTDVASATATNNDYTRLRNALLATTANGTLNLSGTFDWTEANAATSWSLGNDGVVSPADDYGLVVPANLNGVTFTAPNGIGTATIQGPGDLAGVNLEGGLVFDGGDNQNWTISNTEWLDFDLAIYMGNGAGGSDAFNGTTITNNHFRIPADLNAVTAPADVNQNIGLHYSFGTNQTISNNVFDVVGSGLSNGTNFSSSVVMQSNTSGGNVYNGLQITGNTMNVTGALAAQPSTVLGIWENAHAHSSTITVSNNTFTNLTGANAATNLMRAFRVTSHSSGSSTVTYSGNSASGANIGMQWIAGSNFASNNPVVVSGNTFNGNATALLVQSNGKATLSGNDFDDATDNTIDVDVVAGSVVTSAGTNQWAGDTYYVRNNSASAIPLLGDGFDETDNFRRADRVYDALDNAASGLVRYTATDLYVSGPGTGASDETIQRGVDASTAGQTLFVEAGSFAENVLVNKTLTVQGQGAASTTVVPAISNPNCGGGGGGSLCGGASNVFLVEANNVVIKDLKIDGNNPLISSSTLSGGVDVDARNGIITNHLAGTFTGLEVANVTVQNIYLRGIYASSGGSFNLHHNTVTNVAGDAASIGMFAFGGSGSMWNNAVSGCNDAIATNQGSGAGIQIYGNTVTGSGSGVHTDNWNGPGTVHIHDNTVSAGMPSAYGIWAFATYYPVLIENNTISGQYVGLMHAGAQAPAGVVTFSTNEVATSTYGFYQTTSLFGFGDVNVSSVFSNNKLTGCTTGMTLETNATRTRTLVANQNSITGSSMGAERVSAGTDVDDLTCNYWGVTTSAGVAALQNGTSNYLPFDNNGTDTAPATLGYQPAPFACGGYPVINTTTSEGFLTIQAGHDDPQTLSGHTLALDAYTFNERVTLSKSLTIDGAAEATTILTGTGLAGTGSGITLNNGVIGVTIQDLTVKNFAGNGPNSSAGIYAIGGNNTLSVQNVTLKDNVGGAGFYANGPVDGVTLNNLDVSGHTNVLGAARGIVIWNGLKSNITITNCDVYNNNCCGIELQDGTASGVTMTGNNVHDNGDNGMGLTGLGGTVGPNVISGNTLTNNGRYGMEVKMPGGNGTDTGAGSVVVENNTVTFAASVGMNNRDHAGIAVFRRGMLPANANNNVDIPRGVVVRGNTVSGYQQLNPSAVNSEGFGIVIEGVDHSVSNNILSNNNVGLQLQGGGHNVANYVENSNGDGLQDNGQSPNYFGRGNAPYVCNVTTLSNTFSSNGTDERVVTSAGVLAPAAASNQKAKGVNVAGTTYCTIQKAVDKATSGQTANVYTASYDEQVLVNKSMTIDGASPKPTVDFTGTVTGKPTLFDVSAQNVTIRDLALNVDHKKLSSAVIATSATGIGGLQLLNNDVMPYASSTGGAFGSYGTRNAFSVNYGAYRVTGGGGTVTFSGNTVGGRLASDPLANGTARFFRAGLSMDECNGTASTNTLQTINQDVEARFGLGGGLTVQNNQFNGGGLQVSDPNAGGGPILVNNNIFNGSFGNTYTSMLRLKNNYTGLATNVSGNTFTNTVWAASLENYQSVNVTGNNFTPAAGSTTYRHLTVNTKELSSSSGFYTPVVGLSLQNNIFNGSGTPGGTGVAFYNHDNDSPVYGPITFGGTGVENEFNTGIATFIRLDNSIGATNPAPVAFPEYAGLPSTTMACWTPDIDISENLFDVGGGLKAPGVMTSGELTSLATALFDKQDDACVGKLTFLILRLNAKALLEGAYVGGGVMDDQLRAGSLPVSYPLIPTTHPYSGAPWNYTGTEATTAPVLAVSDANNAIVDWVLVELRDAFTPTTVVARRAALVQRDGDIVDVDGVSPVSFLDLSNASFRVAVRHRNHLGTMTAGALSLSPVPTALDLTSPSTPTYGTNGQTNIGGVMALWMGNSRQDNRIKYTGTSNDRDPILVRIGGTVPTNTVNGYWVEDNTLDGQVKYTGAVNDREPILINLPGGVTSIRNEQLP